MRGDGGKRDTRRAGVVAVVLAAPLSVLMVSVAVLALACSAAGAATLPARLSGDRIDVDLEADVARAEGNVVLTYDDLRVTCDRLEVDISSGRLKATGKVTFQDGDDVVTGETLEYDLAAKRGSIAPGRATVTGERMAGDMYVSGALFSAEPGKITVSGASFTTCELDEPHYHVEAGELEIYIDDRMVLRQVSYWEGRVRLFYWPYLVIPVREENRFELPKVGYGPTEGWFVKTTYNYYRSPSYRGALYLDYFSRLGVGAGVRHSYGAGTLGEGSIYLYGLANTATSHADADLEVSHDVPLGEDSRATIRVAYEDAMSASGILDTDLTASVDLGLRSDDGQLRLTLEDASERGEEASDQLRAHLSGAQEFGPGLSLSATANFLDRRVWSGTGSDEKYLNYRVQAVQDLSLVTIRATAEQYVKPSEQREKEEEGEVEPLPYEAIGRLPEVVVQTRQFQLGSIPLKLQLTAGYGSYAERAALSSDSGEGIVRASRTEVSLAAPNRSYALSNWAKATLSGGLTWDGYSTGDSRYVASAIPGLEAALFGGALTLRARYEYCGVFGESPFAFDAEERTGLLAGSLRLAAGAVSASLEAGYDFYTRTYEDVVADLKVSSGKAWTVEAEATYDPDTASMELATGKIELAPSENWKARLGARYSFTRQALDRVESEVALKPSDAWGLEWVLVYGGPASSKEVLRGDVAISHDMHCREIRLSYSYTRNEVWLEYRIKAFPYEGLRFGLGDEGILF